MENSLRSGPTECAVDGSAHFTRRLIGISILRRRSHIKNAVKRNSSFGFKTISPTAGVPLCDVARRVAEPPTVHWLGHDISSNSMQNIRDTHTKKKKLLKGQVVENFN